MKPLSFREVRRKLEKRALFKLGSHIKFAKVTDEGIRTATVPRHREVASGTLRSILRQAELSDEAFRKL